MTSHNILLVYFTKERESGQSTRTLDGREHLTEIETQKVFQVSYFLNNGFQLVFVDPLHFPDMIRQL